MPVRPGLNSNTAEKLVLNPNSKEFVWERDVAILELLFAGGLKVSELCKLELGDFSTDHLAIKINEKGNKERTIYLENIEVAKALNRYLKFREAVGADNPYIFISKFHEPLSTQAVRSLVNKYAKLAGIDKKITPHIFRHSFASLLLEEGVDIKYIQGFSGTQFHINDANTSPTTSNQKRRIMATKHPRQKLFMLDIAPMADMMVEKKNYHTR